MKLFHWRLAFRNLFRQKARLSLNLILLVGAFASIVIFKGFKTHVLNVMKDILIDTQYGHVQVAKTSFWDNVPMEQNQDKMLSGTEALAKKISELEGVEFVTPRVEFYGLLNTEDKSIPAHFIGVQPDVETRLQKHLFFSQGEAFTQSKQLIIGSGIQKKLRAKIGEDLTVVSQTINGSINAMDIKIKGVFGTGFDDIDNETVYLSLQDAQKIYDSSFFDRLVIRAKDPDNFTLQTNNIRTLIAQDGPANLGQDNLMLKSWRELSDIYLQVEGFYEFQNFAIELILLTLVILSISNTMNMVVFERLSEIGTLRALGDYESDIQMLFFIEAVLMGLLAVVIAIPISYVFMITISNMGVTILLPLASLPMPFRLVPYLGSFIEAALVCFSSIVLASLWPARRGSKVSIVEALRARI